MINIKNTQRRCAIFGHYDKNNKIQNYVIHYLKGLQEIADTIIFISDCNLPATELSKIKKITKHIIAYRHGEYDFGSYKRGFLYAKENLLLEHCKELIFCNDSCYGPIYPFREMFNTMESDTCDFWGATYNPVGLDITENDTIYQHDYSHIQSFFLVFRPQVFNSEVFAKFINNIRKEDSKWQVVINYEIGLTEYLNKHGFKESAYCKLSYTHSNSQIAHYLKLILNDKCPLLKVSIARAQRQNERLFQILKKYTNYNVRLIKKDIKENTGEKYTILQKIFSIRNVHKHKVITMFGIKLKIKWKTRNAEISYMEPKLMKSTTSKKTISYRIKTFLQTIFSIKNHNDYKHIIITILGLKITLKKYPISIFVDLFRKNYPNYISLGIIIKDEAKDIKEWIEYHRLIGVEKFYIYDDNSKDNVKEILKPYIDEGIVDYKLCSSNVIDRQVKAYNDLIKRCKYQTKWIGFIDADEFIVPIEKNNLKDFLKSYEKYSGLGINWMCFDSNGHKKRPKGLVIENYTRIHEKRESFIEEYHIKSIVNPRLVRRAEVHHCDFYIGYHVDENMESIRLQRFPKGHFLESWNSGHPHLRTNCNAKKIIINHYWSKSEEDYKQRLEKGFATHEDKRLYEEKRLNFSEYSFNTCIIDKYLNDLKKKRTKKI